MYTRVKSQTEIDAMRVGGKILATTLESLSSYLKVGMTTKQVAERARQLIDDSGAEPAFLGYEGFPDVICISVNREVVHGIPSNLKIKSGDIVSLDLGVKYKNMIVDGALSVVVGESDKTKDAFLNTTKEALSVGIKQVRDGCNTGDISQAIQEVLQRGNYGIIRDLVGHGVGHAIHEEPNIPNYGKRGSGSRLEAGMTIAIEPMATTGQEQIQIERDGWTVTTRDGSLAAHFEHTVLVTKTGFEILTIS